MQTYEHGGDIYRNTNIRLDFSVNLNPLGMPGAVRDAIVQHVGEYETYPDAFCRSLCQAIAAREQLPPDQVLCGNGAADLILRICLALRPRHAVVPSPTFSEYARSVRIAGGRITQLPLCEADGFALTDDWISSIPQDADLLFLCTPNNPTGNLLHPEAIRCVAERCRRQGCLVVVDECFLPFTDGTSVVPLMESQPNLLVLRAFTKIYSMAGLRLGMLLCADTALLARIADAAQVWSVSSVAQAAGLAALSLSGWEEQTRRLVREERCYLQDELAALGLTVFPSDANFLLLRGDRPLYEPLRRRGILVRACNNFSGLDDRYFRIGVKTRPRNEALVQAIREV